MAIIQSILLTESFQGCNTVQTPDATTMAGGAYTVAAENKMFINNQGSEIGQCMTCIIKDTDSLLFGGIRAEITSQADNGASEFWYKWEQYIPEDFGVGAVMTTMQIHDTPDDVESAKFPNFLFATDGEEVFCYIPNNAPTEALGGKIIGRLSLIKGRWTTCVLHVRWDNSSSSKVGFIEVFYDNVTLAKRFLEYNHYPDVIGPYLKIGLYDAFDTPLFGTRTAHFKNIEKHDSSSTYLNVLGDLPVHRQIFV